MDRTKTIFNAILYSFLAAASKMISSITFRPNGWKWLGRAFWNYVLTRANDVPLNEIRQNDNNLNENLLENGENLENANRNNLNENNLLHDMLQHMNYERNNEQIQRNRNNQLNQQN